MSVSRRIIANTVDQKFIYKLIVWFVCRVKVRSDIKVEMSRLCTLVTTGDSTMLYESSRRSDIYLGQRATVGAYGLSSTREYLNLIYNIGYSCVM